VKLGLLDQRKKSEGFENMMLRRMALRGRLEKISQ